MKYLFLAAFFTVTLIHLYASAKKDKKLRSYTKGFILVFLTLWYVFAVETVDYVLVLALFFSWLGDMLLIPKGIKWFTFGGIAFMISHVMFVLTYMKDIEFSVIPFVYVVIIAAVYLVLSVLVFKGLEKYIPKALFIAMFFYLLINSTQNCFAFYRMLSIKNTAGLITFIGATQFFISDSTLFYVRFKKDGKERSHFWVMLTYTVAEFLIVLGLVI